ncbi:MAG TPA: nitroreductase family deazaflavin-dependent oxidoreductase [Anaerolineales bacterium]|nr:nitroreductase family deazaflavin-dependent oxidoreductase [Anaerolineales bacterium]
MLRKFFHFLHDLSVSLYRLTHGKIGGRVQGLPVLLLKTIGRKTGKERITPLGYFMNDGSYIITASNAGRDAYPGWFHNLRANPRVAIEVKDRQIEAEAKVAAPEKRNVLWSQLISLSPAYANYARKTSREIPLVILRPLGNG